MWRGLSDKLRGAVSFRLGAASHSTPAVENKCPNLRLSSPHPSPTPRVERAEQSQKVELLGTQHSLAETLLDGAGPTARRGWGCRLRPGTAPLAPP